ncbi:DUF7720 family protein [Streptococcus pseudopneumoniae]|uniref:DUF7720 family protein n=1 Tax=Streptococcus TaxID=1301 RepID=UPI003BEF084D
MRIVEKETKVLNIKFASIKKTRLGFEHHVEATFSTSIQKITPQQCVSRHKCAKWKC